MSHPIQEETPATVLVKLRTRMNDLLRLGLVTPEGFGLYRETMLQLLQEFDRRKAACLEQAEDLRRKAAAVEAQGHAFGVSGNVLFAIVNGYIDIQERSLREAQERAQERVVAEAEAPQPVTTPAEVSKGKGGPPKKSKESVQSGSGVVPNAPNKG